MSSRERKAARAADARGREYWTAARRLGGELHLEYTFSEFVLRTLALEPEAGPDEPRGLDLSYEQLGQWDDVVGVFSVNDQLAAGGVPEDWQYNVGVGMRFFDSGYRAPGGRLPLPTADDPLRGRHSARVLGVSDDGDLAFANSWGARWGDDGIGYISRPYCEEHVDSVLVTRLAWLGPSGAMDREMARRAWTAARPGRALPHDFVESWTTPNRRQVKDLTIDGETFEVLRRVSFSAAEDVAPVDLVGLKRKGGRYVARMHLRHPRGLPLSVIDELYVHPDERRRGYGTALETVAVELAQRRDRSRLKVVLYEADAGTGADAAEAFARSHGYTWHLRSSQRPNIRGIGTKGIPTT